MTRFASVLTALLIATVAAAQEMPDPSVIHGRGFPVPELRDGTVTVRVVREAIGNDVTADQ